MRHVRLAFTGLRERLRWLRCSQAAAARRARRFSLWLAFIGAALVAVLGVVLPTPSTLVSAELSTESVQFRVTAPQAAAMALRSAIWEEQGLCLRDVLVEPKVGATVRYTRPGRDALQILVTGPVNLTHQARDPDDPLELQALSLLVSDADTGRATATPQQPAESGDTDKPPAVHAVGAAGCAGPAVQRLPVVGDDAVFGAHPLQLAGAQDVQPRLLGGRLTVYGRARSHVFGMRFVPDSAKQALYVAGEFTLPGGTVIEDPSSTDEGAGRQKPTANWSGFADTNFTSDSSLGLTVHATTNTGTVNLFLPAPNLGPDARNSGDPETVSISLMARLFGDPHLLLIYGFLALIALGLGLVNAIRELLDIGRGDA